MLPKVSQVSKDFESTYRACGCNIAQCPPRSQPSDPRLGPTSASTPTFTAVGSAEQVYVTGLAASAQARS